VVQLQAFKERWTRNTFLNGWGRGRDRPLKIKTQTGKKKKKKKIQTKQTFSDFPTVILL